MAGLGTYNTDQYGRIGVYRLKLRVNTRELISTGVLMHGDVTWLGKSLIELSRLLPLRMWDTSVTVC